MTYEKLGKLIDEMSSEQKKMDVMFLITGEYITPTILSEVVHSDASEVENDEEDGLKPTQPILA